MMAAFRETLRIWFWSTVMAGGLIVIALSLTGIALVLS